MSTTAIRRERTGGALAPAVRAGAAGLVAGIPLALWLMIGAIFTSSLWAPPQGIAQAVGIGHAGHGFQIVPFILGVMGHMVNSVILGLVFLGVATIMKLRGLASVIVGMVYGLVVYEILYWGLLRGALSATSASFLSANPEWFRIAGHLLFGGVLGLLFASGPLRRQEV